MTETRDTATELMVLRLTRVLTEIDCNRDYQGMVMKNAGDKWGLDPEFAGFLARLAVRSIGVVEST
jgi:hypothetical protein